MYYKNGGRAVNALKKTAELLYFPLLILYLELVVAIHAFGGVWGLSLLYITLFSFSAGFFMYGICLLISQKGRFVVMLVITVLLTVIFGIQAVYYTIFKTFTVLSSVLHAGDVLSDFGDQAIEGIWSARLPLIFLILPIILFAVFGKKFLRDKCSRVRTSALGFGLFLAFYLGAVGGVYFSTTGIMSYRYAYFGTFSQALSVPRFGVLTTLRLDIQNMLSIKITLPEEEMSASEQEQTAPDDEPVITPEPQNPDTPDVSEPEPVVYEPRVLEIDFDSLIAGETDSTIKDMHEYFSTVEPTYDNEYTGMFKGKNLIWIVAEAFSSFAVDETHTPTLYKLSNEGFVFNNFYNPVWNVSTSDGEYVALTSLIPKSGVWSFSRSGGNSMPFAFGNLLGELGYTTKAYHDHTYTYYDRDTSHPNMGYDYKAVGNGLDIKETWPESDVEMMEKTIPEYVDSEPFHTYYLTVSGHMNYNFMGNTMSYKHKSEVQDMLDAGYSEAASAYVACQMEFDQSVEYLINSLSDAGVLDDTVIVISGDHYPYGLEVPEIEELYGGNIDEEFEIHRSTLIIWSNAMTEPVQVDKYCSSLDIMPTLANLFDLDVDSRLIMGRDILSDASPLVIFNDRSFITDIGRYNSKTDTFTPNNGAVVPEGYATQMMQVVNDKFEYSAKILDNDYYAKVFKDELVS